MKPSIKLCLLSLCLLLACPYTMADDSAPIPSDTVQYLVANATVCPVRENPSYAAEQATQLLFGEVQASVWNEQMIYQCQQTGINILK